MTSTNKLPVLQVFARMERNPRERIETRGRAKERVVPVRNEDTTWVGMESRKDRVKVGGVRVKLILLSE